MISAMFTTGKNLAKRKKAVKNNPEVKMYSPNCRPAPIEGNGVGEELRPANFPVKLLLVGQTPMTRSPSLPQSSTEPFWLKRGVKK